MYTPIAPPAKINERVLTNLQILFGARAQEIYDSCDGKATKLIDMLRHKSGRGWSMLRASRELHEVALLEMAAVGPAMNAPAATRQFVKHYLATRPFEVFM